MTAFPPMREGILTRGIGSFYTVEEKDGTRHTVRAKKKFRKLRLTPMVGDRVRFTPGSGEEHGWLEEILPRDNEMVRPPVSNISLLLMVIAPAPEADLLLVDRMLAQARRQGIERKILVNKQDLDPDLSGRIREIYRGADCEVLSCSAVTGEGLEAVRRAMTGQVSCLAGQSGVGKSSLLNAILETRQETGEISPRIARGRNTTRHVELFTAGGIRVLDTAGFSLLEMTEIMDPVTLKEDYPEFVALEGQCRFSPCLHDREPGCAVMEAVRAHRISPERVERYRILLGQVRETWKERYD